MKMPECWQGSAIKGGSDMRDRSFVLGVAVRPRLNVHDLAFPDVSLRLSDPDVLGFHSYPPAPSYPFTLAA